MRKVFTVLIAVMVILVGISALLVVEGNKREDPGTLVWEKSRFENYSFSRYGDFFVSDDVLYGGGNKIGYEISTQVIAVDIEEDEVLWNHSYHGFTRFLSIMKSNGIVYSGDEHGNVTAVDAETGEKIWTNPFHEGSYIGRVNSIHVSDGMIFTASRNGTVVGADAESGEKYWAHEHHEESVSSVHVEEGKVYTGSLDGNVTAADAETGEKIWYHQLHQDSVSSLYVQDGVIYSGGWDDEVIAYDAEKEEMIWSHSHHDENVLSLHVNEGIVYSGCWNGYVTATDSGNGEKLWRHSYHGGRPINSIQMVDGKVYSHCRTQYMLSVENEGSLTLGISRTLSIFWAMIREWIPLFTAIALATIAILIVKPGGGTTKTTVR